MSQFSRLLLTIESTGEPFLAVLQVREDDVVAMTIETVVLPFPLGCGGDLLLGELTRHLGAIGKTMTPGS